MFGTSGRWSLSWWVVEDRRVVFVVAVAHLRCSRWRRCSVQRVPTDRDCSLSHTRAHTHTHTHTHSHTHTHTHTAALQIGMASIGFWVCCQVPQFYKNCKTQSVSALSGWFLAEWALGDSLNLIGSLLSGQLATALYTAMFFVFADTCLCLQYM